MFLQTNFTVSGQQNNRHTFENQLLPPNSIKLNLKTFVERLTSCQSVWMVDWGCNVSVFISTNLIVHTDAFLYLSFTVETVFRLLLIIRIFTVQVRHAAVCSNVQNIRMLARVSPWCTLIEQWRGLMHQSQQNKHTRTLPLDHYVPTWDLIDMSFSTTEATKREKWYYSIMNPAHV